MLLYSSSILSVLRLGAVALVAVSGTVLAACGDSGDTPDSASAAAEPDPEAEAHPTVDPNATPTPDPGPATTTVKVELREWAVISGRESVPAGVIQFIADNTGKETHELVIVKDGEELAEIEGVAAGYVRAMRFKLEPGEYELACLIVETEPDGTKEDHYKLGMHATFEVK
jgi:hypothetical protein